MKTFTTQILYFIFISNIIFLTSCTTAEKLISENKLEEAEVLCAKKKGDKQDQCYYNLANAYFQEDNFSNASEMYQKAGKFKEGCTKIADTLLSEWNIYGAFEYYKKAGKNIEGSKKIADKLFEDGNYPAAYEFYEKAGEVTSGAKKIANVFLQNKKYSEAIFWYEVAGIENEGNLLIADELYNEGWYGWAFTLFNNENNADGLRKCLSQITDSLSNMENGILFDSNLPEKGAVLLTNDVIISNSESYQLKLHDLLARKSVLLPEQNTVYGKFAASELPWQFFTVIDSKVILYDLITREPIKTFNLPSSVITDFIHLPGSNTFLSSSWDNTISYWDINNDSCITLFSGHESGVTAIAADKNAEILVSGSWDESIRVWDIASGQQLKKFLNKSPLMDVAISANGEYIASCGKNNFIKIWDVKKNILYKTLKAHKNNVDVIEISNNDKYLISGDFDGKVIIWNYVSGKLVKSFQAHDSPITAISIAPNSLYFVTCGMDHNIKFWWLEDKITALSEIKDSIH